MKKIVFKREGISNLNDNQMNQAFGGRGISAETMKPAYCDSVYECCTAYKDCTNLTILACNPSVGFTCIMCDSELCTNTTHAC